jgi:2-polyprenyl-3-methyl-5-hydroxy-6-metoxy-1,4-benzoquinol methylase
MVGNVATALSQETGSFDLIVISAVLHHLNDDECASLFRSLEPLLREGGRIVTIDAVDLPKQRIIAKLFNGMDSGLNIRTPEAYLRLFDGLPFIATQKLFHDLLRIPYDHIIMTVRKTA